MKEGLYMIMGNMKFQQEYFRIYSNHTESTTHRNTYWVKLATNVDTQQMMRALSKVVQQHPSLRQCINTNVNNDYTMTLHEFLPFIEIQQVPFSSTNYDLDSYFKKKLNRFHYNGMPLFKFKLFQFTDATFILLDFHVTIFDDSQLDIFLNNMSNVYRDLNSLNNTKHISHLNDKQKDKCTPNQDESYIQSDCFRLENNSDIYKDSYFPIKFTYEKPMYKQYVIDDMSSVDLKSLAVSVYLANHIISQQYEVTMGMHLPSRFPSEYLLTLHGSIVPLTLKIDNQATCHHLISEFDNIVFKNANTLQSAKTSLLLETIFHCYYQTVTYRNDVVVDIHQIHDTHTSLADIEIFPNEYGYKIIYNSEAYDLLSIETLSNLVQNIYVQISRNKEMIIGELNLMTKNDMKIYDSINLDIPVIDDNQTVVDLFERQVEATPDHIAAKFEGEVITYQNLNARANDLARRLRLHYNVKPNDRIAVIANRSIEMIVAMLGVLKAGGAYVPIDPNYPDKRQTYILNDAMPKVVITYQVSHKNSKQNIPHIELEQVNWQDADNLPRCNTIENHAYVIYTSGTTGKPKGTLIPHRGIVRLVHQNHYVPLNEETTVLLSGTVAFDAATFEIYGALLNGGTIIITSKEQLLNPSVLGRLIKENDVNTMWLTSSLYNQIVSEHIEILEPLSYLLIGGEVLNAKWVNLLNQRLKHPQIINGYGPTENTTFTTTYAISSEVPRRIPIGKPILGTHVYVMQDQRCCGVGVPGELCIEGLGLATGYLNQPKMTADKFIMNAKNHQLMYKSGDIVRLLPDGNIDYLYRMDKQVKIRGFRIELSEIEHALEHIQGINKAVVIVQTYDQEDYIVAYYEGMHILSNNKIKAQLRRTLPEYMIPVNFLRIEQIPISINGKIDKKSLPKLDFVDMGTYVPPSTDIEHILCQIFEDILNVQQVGIHDNFFELGGHSLKATLVVNRIEEYTGKRLKISDLLQKPTVFELAQAISTIQEQIYESIPIAMNKEDYVLSSTQQRMYLLWQANPKDTVYNVPFLWRLSSDLNVAQLRHAIHQLIARHEVLRTQYIVVDDEVRQRIKTDVEVDFEEVNTHFKDEQRIMRQYIEPFNLEKPSQIRVRYIRSPLHSYLFIDTHHIINDGMSNIQLVNDLNAFYQNKNLSPLTLQYKDYSEWMARRDMARHRQYWISQFEDGVPILSMPTDYVRPNVKTTNGAMISFSLSNTTRRQLQQYVEEHQVTDFMFFMSVVMVLLGKYARKEDITVGSVMSARMHSDTERMLGMFANTLVYRGQPVKEKMWTQFLQEIKELSLAAYEHQEYPFDRLVADLDQAHDASRNPLFDVMLVLQNNETNHSHFGHSKLTYIPPKSVTSKFDLAFILEEDCDNYTINIEYNSDLYRSQTIQNMGQQFIAMIEYILAHNEPLQIKDIPNDNTDLLNWVNTHVNNRTLDVPGNKSIIEYFDEIVAQRSNHAALVMNDLTMSYETLQHYVNKIARILTSKGIVRGQRIALLAERSFEMIAAMLATVKLGVTYVPIDIDCPKKRREIILEDAQIVAIMIYGVDIETTLPVIDLENVKCHYKPGENDYGDRVSCGQDYETYTKGNDNHGRVEWANCISDEALHNQYDHESDEILDNQCEKMSDIQGCEIADNLHCGEMMLDNEMYAIYTSGTTGVPKGVVVNQRNLLNLVYAWSHELQLQDTEVFLQHANIVFDASVMEIYCCLLNGHTLVIPNKAQRVDPEELQQLITKHHITVASIPLQMCSMMKDFYIEKLITGGATSTPSFVNYIEHHCGTYYNAYGPSESTVITSYWSHQCADKVPKTIPIGKPLSNIQVYIMSEGLLCGVGMPGELCIAGDSLALGYINRPELTDDKWQDNPFGKGKLYHSGDLARYTPDGQIEFLGRIDKQVKVNGYRIELDEIENAMLAIYGVSDCVVTVKHFGTHDILNAYYVGQPHIEQHVKYHLLEHLPKYMVPKTVTHINHMPLTANDKVDKSQLPEPSVSQQNGKRESEAANEIEQAFINVFETVLKQNHIGVDDDFFELGGNSLEAMLVVSRLKALGYHISMQTLYQYKTVKRIVKYMYQCQQLKVTLPKNYPELQQMVESHYSMGVFEYGIGRGTLGNVLLTGATGFLGAYLIEALQGYNNRIYCFIRAYNNDDAWDKLLTNLNYYFSEETVEKLLPNIEIIVGDLEHMNEVALTGTIDTIIHAGARTNHFGDDTEFEKVNVQGTIDIIRVARQHQAKLIYISTISVGTYFDMDTEETTFSEADVYKGQLLTSPYTRSKFYSELKVLEAVKDGLNGRIIRVGNLTSPYKGRWHMRNIKTNRFSIVMNDLLQLDCLGDGLAETPVDLSFVDMTARQIVVLAKLNMPPIIYHVLSPHKMTMKSLLENVKRKEINIVSDRYFDQMLHKQQMYETIGLTSVDYGQQLATIDAEKTLSIMKDIGEQWPTMTSEWLYHWAQYIQTIFNK